jgi:hypothetical protein
LVSASPNAFSGQWTTYDVIDDGDKYLGVCRVLEMNTTRWTTRLLMRSELPSSGEKDLHPVVTRFVRNEASASDHFSRSRYK